MKTSSSRPGTRLAGRQAGFSDFYPYFPARAWLLPCWVGLALMLMGPLSASAQLQFVSEPEPPRVLGSAERKLAVTLHNASNAPFEGDIHTRLYQANSTKATLLSAKLWKHLQVLPGQTVHDFVTLSLPSVKEETRFRLLWTEGDTTLLHISEVLVYPADLLKGLKPLVGNEPLGLFDPSGQLKPLLKAAEVEFQDLEKGSWEEYHGKLAILGPFPSRAKMRGDLPMQVKALAEAGVAVLWIQPPPEKRQELQPSFYTVPEGKAAVVVVQAALLANLAENPQTQLHFLKLARLALYPEPLRLPGEAPPPAR